MKIMLEGLKQLVENSGKNSGNARFVRELVEKIIMAKNARIANQGTGLKELTDKQLNEVTSQDVTNALVAIENKESNF